MNAFSNIWNHPKTSAAGLLIAVVTIANVFSQQGISLGNAGSGTVVALISALSTALLGLFAKDPGEPSTATNSTAKLGAWALIMLLFTAAFQAGCSGTTVAQDIVNWTPTLESAIAVVDSTASVLDPSSVPIFTAATVGFDAAANVLVAEAKAYLADPDATTLAKLQTAVVTLQQQVNSSLLSVAKITNPASQQKALTDVNAVATVVNAIFALVESVSNKAAVARMSAASTVKLAAVEPYLNHSEAASIVARHYAEPVEVARMQVTRAELSAVQAGF